jgi:hypothetical protein
MNPSPTEAPLPPPGTRFQTWRARPIPSDPQELIAYRREAVDIFVATDAIGAELGGDLALTQSVLSETQKRLQAANDDITLLQEEVAALRNDLNHEKTTVRTLNQALANAGPASSHPKTQDLPAPPRFNGERSRLKAWKNSVNIKLNGDAAKFPDAQHRLAYIFGLLEGKAADQIQPYVLPTGINLTDVPAMLAILDRAFGDPDPIGTATRAFRALKQKNTDLSTYVAEFSKLAAEVPWDDRAKLDHFQEGLSYELKQALVHYPDAPSLEVLIDQASKIEQKLARLRNHPRNPSAPTTTRQPSGPAPAATPREDKPATHASFVAGGPTPMDLSSGRPRLTQEERDRRRNNGLCIACGKNDHFIAACPIRKKRPNHLNVHATTVGPEEEESGKGESLA